MEKRSKIRIERTMTALHRQLQDRLPTTQLDPLKIPDPERIHQFQSEKLKGKKISLNLSFSRDTHLRTQELLLERGSQCQRTCLELETLQSHCQFEKHFRPSGNTSVRKKNSPLVLEEATNATNQSSSHFLPLELLYMNIPRSAPSALLPHFHGVRLVGTHLITE